jgi:hypothetical protein
MRERRAKDLGIYLQLCMTYIDHPSQIPEPYDLASFSRHGQRHTT